MRGGTFSISSLGGIGGTSFTPIINAPEVASSRGPSQMRPVYRTRLRPSADAAAVARYDHRVIDGAAGRVHQLSCFGPVRHPPHPIVRPAWRR